MTRPLWLLLAFAGCPALGHGDVERLSDQDGDGEPSLRYGGRDCDDRDPSVRPGNPEVCDGVDNDCDGVANALDDDAVGVDWYRDADGDGFASAERHLRSCEALGDLTGAPWLRPPDDGVFDCDDTDADEFPGQRWRFDGDGDGFAVPTANGRVQCDRPPGMVVDQTDDRYLVDCDDRDPATSPGAPEVCNGEDDDCDHLVDDNDGDVQGRTTYWLDEDHDGFGGPTEQTRCDQAAGWLPVGNDCDDADETVHPGAPDQPYDGTDRDCSGSDDDFDGDGFLAHDTDLAMLDCDDTERWTYPNAPNVCDGEVNDCSGDPYVPEDEAGAHFVGPPVDSEPLSAPRGYTDFTMPLSDGELVALPGDGTLFLCSDQTWSGWVQGIGSTIVVTSPNGPATLEAPDVAAFALELTGAQLLVEDVVVDGTLALNATGPGESTVRRVRVGPTGLAIAVTQTLTLSGGPYHIEDAEITGSGGAVFADVDSSVSWVGGTLTGFPGLMFYGDPDVDLVMDGTRVTGGALVRQVRDVTLTGATLTNVQGTALDVNADEVHGTRVQLNGAERLRFRGVSYDFGPGPTDFDCGADCAER